MAWNGDTMAPPSGVSRVSGHRSNGFRHPALLYDSDNAFVDAIVPFVHEGLAAGEPILVAARRQNAEALREQLGDEAGRIDLHVAEDWYENAIRTRTKVAHWAAGPLEEGRRIRVVGERPWSAPSSAVARDWLRHEAVINVAFAEVKGTFVCPYDSRVFPDSVLAHVEATHPNVLGSPAGMADYTDPASFCRRLDEEIPSRWGATVATLDFDRRALAEVRRLVERHASEAGIEPARGRDTVVAVNEVATNALLHGAEPATIRVWRAPAELVFEVADSGPGVRDPFAGQLQPDPGTPGGWGVWMARMLSDAVEVRADPRGTTVTVHLATSG